jgi:peptidoglycan/LPS O-acetylase OafA/YrhL
MHSLKIPYINSDRAYSIYIFHIPVILYCFQSGIVSLVKYRKTLPTLDFYPVEEYI